MAAKKAPASLKKPRKKTRDIEKTYNVKQTVTKLRRLADCLENGKPFMIQVAGEKIYVPAHAVFNIEHEREGKHEEVEFQFSWDNLGPGRRPKQG